MFATARYQFPEKYYLIPYFPDGYIVILYPWHASCHFIQLMIMSRKQGSGPRRGMIVNVFSNGPGNGNAVICTGSATDLVPEDQAPCRNIIKNIGSFIHINPEGLFSGRKIILSDKPGQKF